jgi:HNH endonuclease
MSDARPPIPAELQRNLMIEAGYRCAVCKTPTDALEIDHIIEWAKVRKHEFSNMIVLCPLCHARKKNSSDPRHINRASLQKIKETLMLLNGRYSDLERRIIEEFQEKIAAKPGTAPSVVIPQLLHLLVRYLIHDGIVTCALHRDVMAPLGPITLDDYLRLTLTPKGQQFIEGLPEPA